MEAQRDGHDFEYYCAKLLRGQGYKKVKVTPGSGDQGVDILAEKDGIRYAIQCKYYSSKVGNTPVQEVFAGKVYYGCDVAVVMTNSIFTKGAIDLANATDVILWDCDDIAKFEHSYGHYKKNLGEDDSLKPGMMLFALVGFDAHIEGYADRLIIRRHGIGGRLRSGDLFFRILRDKEIYYDEICDIKVKKSNIFSSGYIYFECLDSQDVKRRKIATHENAVMFKESESYLEALDVVEKITQLLRLRERPMLSSADELLKLKQLLDTGVLTEEEFFKEKIKVLNGTAGLELEGEWKSEEALREEIVEKTEKVKVKAKKNMRIALTVTVIIVVLMFGITQLGSNDNGQEEYSLEDYSLSEVETWYGGNLPIVTEALIEYAQGINGVTDIVVNTSEFCFGGENGDCWYKFTFTCKVDGVTHTGEARAFVKYYESAIRWFSLEIFGRDGEQSPVKIYDEVFEKIAKDYYLELTETCAQ